MLSPFRAAVADIAHSQVGVTDPEAFYLDAAPCYTAGAASAKAWCGIFSLFVLRRAGLTDWEWRDGYGFIYRLGWDQATSRPEVGDIAYFKRFQHHAVVVAVDPDADTVTTIDGNSGPTPGKVGAPKTRPRKYVGVTYFSIRKLVAIAEAAAEDTSPTDPAPPPVSDPPPVRDLRRGDMGEDVAEWQRVLLERGYDLGPWRDDGEFGGLTEAATIELQRGVGIAGVVDARTREAANR